MHPEVAKPRESVGCANLVILKNRKPRMVGGLSGSVFHNCYLVCDGNPHRSVRMTSPHESAHWGMNTQLLRSPRRRDEGLQVFKTGRGPNSQFYWKKREWQILFGGLPL